MLISAALSLASLGAKAISGITNSIRMGKEKKSLQSQGAKLDDWYNAESNQDYLNTGQAQSVLAKLRESLAKKKTIDQNTAAVSGGTVESELANNQVDNQAVSDTMTGIAGQGTAYKTELRKDYTDQKTVIDNKISDLSKNQMQSAVNAGSNAMNAFGSVVNANKMDAFGKPTGGSLFQGLFKRKNSNVNPLSAGADESNG